MDFYNSCNDLINTCENTVSELSSSVSGVIENEVLDLPSFSLLAKPTYDAYKIILNEIKKKYSINRIRWLFGERL